MAQPAQALVAPVKVARPEAVKSYLVSKGVAVERVKMVVNGALGKQDEKQKRSVTVETALP